MSLAYSITATIAFFLFMTKFFIHLHLDSKNGYEVKFSPFGAMEYFLIYNKEVEVRFRKLKFACNRILNSAVILFCIALVLLLFKNLIK